MKKVIINYMKNMKTPSKTDLNFNIKNIFELITVTFSKCIYCWVPDTKSSAPLCTGAKSNLRDRVLGEVEKNSFIALPGKGGHNGLLPLKTMCPNPGEFGEEFYGNGSRAGLLTRLGCVQGLRWSVS